MAALLTRPCICSRLAAEDTGAENQATFVCLRRVTGASKGREPVYVRISLPKFTEDSRM